MGKSGRKPRERRCFSSSYFLGCFGVSRKIHSDKQIVDASQVTQKKKTKTRWFSKPTKSGLKNDEITTKPTEKQNLIVEDDKQTLFRVIHHVTDLDYLKEKDTNKERDINPDPLSLSGYDACHEQVTPTDRGGKLDQTKTIESESKPKGLREKSSRVRRFDPIIGIFIMMVTLMIMLIWGRLCAILCTSTWCYFLPRLKEVAAVAAAGKRKRNGGSCPSHMDLNSAAYKKKVILEGFLFRQPRGSL